MIYSPLSEPLGPYLFISLMLLSHSITVTHLSTWDFLSSPTGSPRILILPKKNKKKKKSALVVFILFSFSPLLLMSNIHTHTYINDFSY